MRIALGANAQKLAEKGSVPGIIVFYVFIQPLVRPGECEETCWIQEGCDVSESLRWNLQQDGEGFVCKFATVILGEMLAVSAGRV